MSQTFTYSNLSKIPKLSFKEIILYKSTFPKRLSWYENITKEVENLVPSFTLTNRELSKSELQILLETIQPNRNRNKSDTIKSKWKKGKVYGSIFHFNIFRT